MFLAEVEVGVFIPYTFPTDEFVIVTKERSSFFTLNFRNMETVPGPGARAMLLRHRNRTRTLSGLIIYDSL
jgi:hypothetical protein